MLKLDQKSMFSADIQPLRAACLSQALQSPEERAAGPFPLAPPTFPVSPEALDCPLLRGSQSVLALVFDNWISWSGDR